MSRIQHWPAPVALTCRRVWGQAATGQNAANYPASAPGQCAPYTPGEHGLRLYHCDDMQSAHTARSNAVDHPMLHAFIAMTMDERWVKRTPEEMFRTFHGFWGEGFGLILEDLLDLPTDVPVLVEGYQLLPRLIAPLLSRADQAVWLIPTPSFRRTAFCQRGSLCSIAERTSDPEMALANLLVRDALYTQEVERQAAALQLTTIQVNGSASIDELATHIAQCLGIRRQDRKSTRLNSSHPSISYAVFCL